MTEETSDDVEGGDAIKATKHRSPNYPAYGLQKALELAKAVHEKYKRATVPINLSQVLWGFKEHSGAGNQAVAALKSYGLLDVEGKAKERRVRLTDAAYRILMNSPDRADLLKKAAVTPPIHSELWEKYKAEEHFPDDQLIRHYLLWDREQGTFNAETVDAFIADFRASLRYADLLQDDITIGQGGFAYTGEEESLGPPPSTKKPGIGDLVQWSQAGQGPQYPKPRPVQGVSRDGHWVFIEGDPTPRPIDQVFVMVETTDPVRGSQTPPPNPFAGAMLLPHSTSTPPKPVREVESEEIAWGVPPLRFPLPRGNVIEIRLKSKVTQKEFDKLKKLFDLSAIAFIDDDDEVSKPDNEKSDKDE